MRKYHATWWIHTKTGEAVLTGETFEAESMLEALATFIHKHNFEPVYISETFNCLIGKS